MSIKIAGNWIGVSLLSAAICIPPLAMASNTQSLPDSNFEIDDDANLSRDHDAPSFDWEQTVGVGLMVVPDRATGSDDNSFKGGTKEDTVNPDTTTGSIPNNKSDLKEFGTYQESNNDREFLHLFWSRVQNPSGTTLMDFELNKGEAGLYPATSNGDQFPVRQAGDLLIEYKLAQGGITPQLFLYTWLENAGEGECEASNSYPCWGNQVDLGAEGAAIGSINASLISGTLETPYSYDPYTFGEASIDLYQAGIFVLGECTSFGYASLKSRSSDSFSAQMKDYIAPERVDISNCADINITKTDDSDPPVGLEGALFALYHDVGEVGTYEEDVDTLVDITGNPVATDGTGVAGWSDIFAGDYCVVEEEAPAGYSLPSPNWKCFTLSADTNRNLDFTNPRVPGIINIRKEDDEGTLLGDGWVFTLHADNAGAPGTATAFSCSTTAGLCTIEDILPPGTYCVVETTNPAPTMYGDADPQCGIDVVLGGEVNLTFVNPRIPGEINIRKEDDEGTLLGDDWVFTLHADNAGTPGAATAFSCSTSAGLCTIEDILPAGTYCVVETTNPAPTMYGDADPQCGIDVALGGEVNLTFVNPRIPGDINIRKEDDTGALLGDGWVFTLHADDAGTPGTATAFSCSTTAGLCAIEDILPPGTYCVVETTNPEEGKYGDTDPQCNLDVALGGTLNLTFTNPRLTGAILITKTRKHAANGPGDHAHEGVTFTITGGDLAEAGVEVVTDASGQACYDGLLVSSLVGDYTVTESVPVGYVADGEEAKDVSVALASSCGDGSEATVSFGNTPLTDITVSVNSLVDGGTASTIVCTDSVGNVSNQSTGVNGDGSLTVSNLRPTDPTVTLTCVITVDP